MAGNQRAWGIEVGVAAVKAICLERSGDQVAVSDFCVIPHSRTLGDPYLSGQESDAIVRFSLGQLISQKSLEGETLVMNLPGQDALSASPSCLRLNQKPFLGWLSTKQNNKSLSLLRKWSGTTRPFKMTTPLRSKSASSPRLGPKYKTCFRGGPIRGCRPRP